MKREAPSELCGDSSQSEERRAKAQRRERSSVNPDLMEIGHDPTESERRFSPLQPEAISRNADTVEPQRTKPTSLANMTTELGDRTFQWISTPSEMKDIETMSEPDSKWSPSPSISAHREHSQSDPWENSESGSIRDTKSAAYEAENYAIVLEMKGYFMRQSPAGPTPDDIALCEHLLNRPTEVPSGTMFEDEYITRFRRVLQNQSKERLLVDLHPLIMPSAENQFIRGNQAAKNVIDGYNDSWVKSEPIYGPQPQPDHDRGLKWFTFSDSQRQKLGIKPVERSPYTARENSYFPYLTAEIKSGIQPLEVADRQNMHSMCVALRAMVSFYQAAGCPEELHRRILGFSISHDENSFRIHGYYPEFPNGKVSFYRWPVACNNIWSKQQLWACYRFAQNVDREFLPIHTDRLMRILEQIPVSGEGPPSVVDGIDSQLSFIGSQVRPDYRRAASSQSGGLQPELRMMVQTLQQQLAEQREREEKREAEQKAREKLLADEQKQLLAQLEEQRKELNVLQAKLLALLERNTKSE